MRGHPCALGVGAGPPEALQLDQPISGFLARLDNGLGALGLVSRRGEALIVLPLLARIRAEERLLSSEFGDEYEAYRARTSRLIPGLYWNRSPSGGGFGDRDHLVSPR